MIRSPGTAHQRVQNPLAQPGAEHDRPARGQRYRDILVVAIAMRREGEMVKHGERLRQERREVRGADPGGEVVQETLQPIFPKHFSPKFLCINMLEENLNFF
jgi:hypothetical protein